MRQSGDLVRNVCQPKTKASDGKYCYKIFVWHKDFFHKEIILSLDLIMGIREGKFPDDKPLKVRNARISLVQSILNFYSFVFIDLCSLRPRNDVSKSLLHF